MASEEIGVAGSSEEGGRGSGGGGGRLVQPGERGGEMRSGLGILEFI